MKPARSFSLIWKHHSKNVPYLLRPYCRGAELGEMMQMLCHSLRHHLEIKVLMAHNPIGSLHPPPAAAHTDYFRELWWANINTQHAHARTHIHTQTHKTTLC